MQQSPSSPQHTKVRDVWNHASFLVKVAYDLEWAARQFELLESEAPNRQIKAILLLNIGITYTLLADYQRAEKAFRKVLPLHPFTAPLAHFFLGLVRFELTDYEQAQISFKLCACVLRQTDWNRDYRCLGLDFTLSHLLVVENEEIAAYEWTLKQKGRYEGLKVNYGLLSNFFEQCFELVLKERFVYNDGPRQTDSGASFKSQDAYSPLDPSKTRSTKTHGTSYSTGRKIRLELVGAVPKVHWTGHGSSREDEQSFSATHVCC
ncbi:hypothetical protein D6C84_03563 [Aureobasidium pullulans]|uniref:Uncharacterized protein n=2 Tax=Aureobasidium pullulans TaxID=5580 RepID=A0A4S9CDJ6_AURPU|nr:hypothetical protein JADG_004580 [Aureobasidium pullulans]THW95078.1 hypothetical protein D6D15_01588 [Aureobasidium pullulans]THX04290.1 hypothetical protein D6D18_03431 [Aureobasidium pullulans]THX57605.1 hypothetical protein D6D06_03617 [Aureobasidium pullulans]THY82301.1 hypothetical protein D6C93_09258 [Aureobasidium pullulans]